MAGGLEDWRIQEKTALLKWPEDWRIQEFLGEKITLFKMTGGLEDWRIQDDFRRKNYSFLNDWRIGGLEHWSIGGENLDK